MSNPRRPRPMSELYIRPPRFPSRKYRRPSDWRHGYLNLERLLDELGAGTALYKIKSSSRQLLRTFFLDVKNMVLYYTGSKKKSKDTKIPIATIREVREGEKDYSKKSKYLEKNLYFVLVLGASDKIIYLKTSKQEIRDKWIRGLRFAMQMEQLAVQRNESDRSIREAFNKADKNGDGTLDFDEVMKLLKALNANIKKKYARVMFDAADKNKNVVSGKENVLDREEFVTFYNSLTRRAEIEEIFLRYTRGKGSMTLKDLLYFLKDGQKIADANEDDCHNIIDQFEQERNANKHAQLSMTGFRKFLTSEREQLFNPSHRVAYHNMKHPMTHYFIASSHNTYLAEDQLKGPSDVQMYITALQKGCRCVELDCWDGPDDEPVIYHGYTLTSKILFRDVIHAINEYAFKASPYPVILSLENHCSVEQQEVMADIMNSVFGDKLWSPTEDVITTPTPEALRKKIIIKGKRLPAVVEQDDDVSDEDEAADIPKDSVNGDENDNNNKEKDEHKKVKLSPALSKITGMQSVGFKTIEKSAQPDPFFNVISLSENKVEKLAQSDAHGLNAITHHRLIRTYPAGSRTDSSNYNPVPMWNHGCQVVALNYQTGGESMQLNHGHFSDNGGVGYLLKPRFLIEGDMFGVIDGTVSRSVCKILKIMIISGFQIPKPNDSTKGEVIDPFVKIEVYGVPSDSAEYKTKVIENNGFNPRWQETFTFRIRVPELALVRFTVKDEDRGRDDFIGYYCIPVLSIQEGFRHFPLHDKHGNPFTQSLIFTHVTMTNE